MIEINVNSKKEILKSFMGWLPIALAAIVFYGVILIGLIVWILTSYLGFESETAKLIGMPMGISLLLTFVSLYVYWLIRSLSSYRLKVEGNNVMIKGMSGWDSIDKTLSLDTIEKIYLGEHTNTIEKLSTWHGGVRDQIAARLTFVLSTGEELKLDFATKAFDTESLQQFFKFMMLKSIDTKLG